MIERLVTWGTVSLDGRTRPAVDNNNVWLVGDEGEVIVVEALSTWWLMRVSGLLFHRLHTPSVISSKRGEVHLTSQNAISRRS